MLDDDLIASLDWSRARSVQEAMDEREAIMARIERQLPPPFADKGHAATG